MAASRIARARLGFFVVTNALLLVGACAKTPPAGGTGGGGGGAPADAGADVDLDTAPLAGTVGLPLASGRDISPLAFGQNYWSWEPTWGDAIAGTESLVTAEGVKLIRAGGANNDIQTPDTFSHAQLDTFVAYCRSVGAEPLLQAPVIMNPALQPATSADAAAMVTYANVTMGYGIKYWSVGNEPDLYTSQSLKPATYAASDYCATFRDYAAAMKAVDPSIKLVGPDLSYKYVAGNDWLTPFLDGCGDVVDVVSVHRYPFAPTATTVAAALGDAASFRQVVKSLRANLDQHGLTATPLAITEEHITYNGDPTMTTLPASPQTFYAGLWAADVLGVALEEGLWTSAFWHIADTVTGWKLAFIIGTSPQPTYYATSLVAATLTGQILTPTGVPTGFSVYGSRDASLLRTTVMVLNRTAAAARLDFTFDSAPMQEIGFAAQSLTAVVFADGAAAPQIVRYTKDLADASLPPAASP